MNVTHTPHPGAWEPMPMRIENALSAHFKQPQGPSRPGVEWLVAITDGPTTHHARVRALLADDATRATRKDLAYQAQTAMQYLADLMRGGWHPSQPREHLIHIGNPAGLAPARPWWRFW